MSEMFENLERCIRHQLQGHDGDTVEMVGEQLLDMARGDDNIAQILLNDDYFRDGVGNLDTAEHEINQTTLFDYIGGISDG